MKRKFAVLLAVVVFGALPMFASVTFNTGDGTGFVGKGDVMDGLGYSKNWTWVGANSGVNPVIFRYTNEAEYSQTCVQEWTTGDNSPQGPTLHQNVHRRKHTVAVNSSLAYEVRKNGTLNITGFPLLGFGGSTDDPLPESLCTGQDMREFDLLTDTSIEGVRCDELGQCTYTPGNGDPANSFTIYPTLTQTSGSGGVLTVSDHVRWNVIWPIRGTWGLCDPDVEACN